MYFVCFVYEIWLINYFFLSSFLSFLIICMLYKCSIYAAYAYQVFFILFWPTGHYRPATVFRSSWPIVTSSWHHPHRPSPIHAVPHCYPKDGEGWWRRWGTVRDGSVTMMDYGWREPKMATANGTKS